MATVSGVGATVQALEGFVDAVENQPPVLARIGVAAVDAVRPLVPVRTGALRASVRAEVVPAAAVLAVGGPTVTYAGAVNARTNFLGRSLDQLTPTAAQIIADGITDEITARGLD